MTKARMLTIALLLFATCATATEIDPIVAIAQRGWSEWHAIDGAGNFYRFEVYGSRWIAEGNIPALAGQVEDSPFVGLSFWIVSQYTCSPNYPCALTANGNYYQMEGAGTWHYRGNVAASAGHPNSGEFVSLSFSAWPGAMTSAGELYVWQSAASWYYIGSLAADIGAVPTVKEPMGSLKSLFR